MKTDIIQISETGDGNFPSQPHVKHQILDKDGKCSFYSFSVTYYTLAFHLTISARFWRGCADSLYYYWSFTFTIKSAGFREGRPIKSDFTFSQTRRYTDLCFIETDTPQFSTTRPFFKLSNAPRKSWQQWKSLQLGFFNLWGSLEIFC